MSGRYGKGSKGAALLLAAILGGGMTGCHSGNPVVPPAVVAAREAHTPVDTTLVEADNEFGFRLFGALAQKEADANLFISPSSIALALDMVYNGAKGDTLQGMAQALGLQGRDAEKLNSANAALLAALSAPDPKVDLAIANGIWVKPGCTVTPDFTQTMQQFYGAEIAPLTSAEAINSWVDTQTRHKITDIVSKEAVRNSETILVDAIYFKGLWATPFKTEATQDAPFTLLKGQKQTVRMMHQSDTYDYYEGDGMQAVRLPYGDGRMQMVILLPKHGVDYRAFLGKMTEANWTKWSGQFASMEGSIALPHFRADYFTQLKEPLTELGMGQAFTANADFSGIAPQLKIGEVLHKTFVEVTEEGTEAAAATAVTMEATAVAPAYRKSFEMVVDHPFVCAIVDSQSKAILFFGSIVDPKS